ncbi:putative UDP-glucuronosyl/UDP-glucosyltransferase, UDP-glycosyltransferase family [Helianthus annuus]|uniref:Glycosyltransferase n=2 Tax=Helianthus annuus TaxID=4232 RepID=A0A251V970_HELAN|nr:putative UDP-glucuronosyl/UDP-glucosyltransferase, UDP-glycosyltransferase family [Helianthus annuus]KAJ0609361.1 putative UDP-glucuronosyl/UDP-glucosyltransferase, UDP-glycosyltransferase family [Helianthus annuus]KAJ0769422.1 putative UDP-glucuronosyl/UDP-glucosyltransferase, UDP-glycosyltransferase family [Helianthus annuus]KAJ0937283.1 putative UDP-glucuronosyl/UDP-glucosyltransferase, UDP-glycosyltransferase family [Helianthus annuus]KAJ0945228.1 putative UDP-glucuronosyl/UDP-glucosyltr
MMMNNQGRKRTVLMFPWLGHGHISPFLELAKKLNNTNLFNIYLCSTPANLDSVKKTLTNECGLSLVQLIELHLPTLPELPPHLHTTNGLPIHLMPTLKQAFDMASPGFSQILKTLMPDLLIYDILQPWAPQAAAALGIPAVVFITTSVAAANNTYHVECTEDNRKDIERVLECYHNSSSIILVKSFKEIEGKYADYFSILSGKRVVPVGPLVVVPPVDMKQNSVIEWLDKKTARSTVFVSFGSEYFLSSADLEEIAYGLEMSNMNFIWVLRFPKGQKEIKVWDALPLGFLERVKNRGLLVEGWAPQTRILGHKNIGGFVSHCGWSSVMEAMKFGVPIIAMPMQFDQPVNARLVVEVGVGVEAMRDGNGRLMRENVAAVVQNVMVSKLGEAVREKTKKMSVALRVKGEEEIDAAVEELRQLCKTGSGGDLHEEEEQEGEEDSIDERAERFIKRTYEEMRMQG